MGAKTKATPAGFSGLERYYEIRWVKPLRQFELRCREPGCITGFAHANEEPSAGARLKLLNHARSHAQLELGAKR
jgi:hypothetical protein